MTAAARPPQRAQAERDRQVLRVIWIEGGANVAVVCLKLWVGLTTGSLAVLSEALHSLSDAANNAVAWFVVRVSSRPADRDHPYGHRKFETVAVFGLASLLTVLAFQIALSVLRREPAPIVHDDTALAVLVDHVAVDPDAIVAAAAAIPGVRAVHDVRSRRTGAGAAVDLVVEVDAHLPTHAAHDISDRVEALLRQRFRAVDVTVHVEPDGG